MEHLILSRRNLQNIPEFNSLENVKKIDLCYNNIKQIKEKRLPNGLEELYVENNIITFIDQIYLPDTLKVLKLSYNYIEELNLDRLINLTILEISNCGIQKLIIPPNLVTLIANNNNIINITLPLSLQQLDLSNNSIDDSNGPLFFGGNLIYVNLSYNVLTKIPYFDDDTPLESLHLTSNSIYKLCEKLPETLTELDLCSNDIINVDEIINYKNLKKLNLQSNNIIEIDQVPPYLEELIISYNNLTMLTFKIPSTLGYIEAQMNEIFHVEEKIIENAYVKLNGNPIDNHYNDKSENDEDTFNYGEYDIPINRFKRREKRNRAHDFSNIHDWNFLSPLTSYGVINSKYPTIKFNGTKVI